MTAAAIQVEVAQVSSMVTTARRLLSAGRMVDLSALEGRVRGLCAEIAGLPPDEGRGLRPSLEALMLGLDRLSDDLRAQHELVCGTDAHAARPR